MTGRQKKRVYFIDDEKVVRDAVSYTLKDLGIAVTCFSNAPDCLKVLFQNTKKCNLIITDVNMPRMNGIEFLRRIKQRLPLLPVLVITAYGDIPMAIQAVKAGAIDFIEKPLDEETFIPVVVSAMKRAEFKDPLTGRVLTQCELEILYKVLQGKSNKQIATELYRSKRTIENHRARIMHKLDVKNFAELVQRAISMGITPNTDEEFVADNTD